MIQPKFSWIEYFSGSPTATTLYSAEYNSRQNPSVTNVYVLNCLFRSISSTSDGGALCCSSSVSYFLVESSSFFSCKTSAYGGGAIYFSNTNNGQCVFYGVCGNDCYSTYTGSKPHGQFVFVQVNDGASRKNYVNYSSVARCIAASSTAYCTLYLCYGKILCPSVNSSLNKCYGYSGILYWPFRDSSSFTCSLTYSSLADDIATNHICVGFNNIDSKYEMKCCNILRNSQTSSSHGVIYTNGNLKIEDSCILENRGTYIIYISSSYPLILSNCTIDTTTNYGSINIQNTVTKSFILGLNHISTQNCNSEYDSIGTLSAVPYVSHSTKKEFYHTCKSDSQGRISISCTIIWLLVFTFIHLNPSIDY
jgi:hypothetical protein